MPKSYHDKVRAGIKKAHPEYSEARLEGATNGTMAMIAKRSRRSGTFPGRGRTKPGARRKSTARKTTARRGKK
jgi:hypothetical protein